MSPRAELAGASASARVLLAVAVFWLPRCRGQCTPDVLSRYPTGWPAVLDYGIYWFGHNDLFEKATGGENKYYDPKKNTVIYFHGWTGNDGGFTDKCKRITTICPDSVCDGPDRPLLAEEWLLQGWNVGFFYWDQFGDEDCTRDAEQKIWMDRGGNGLRWKSYDITTKESKYHEFEEGYDSLADICVKSVSDSMSYFTGKQVRFVGHSIGAQLAIRCAALLHMQEYPVAPRRVALLEPFFTAIHMGYFRCNTLTNQVGLGDFTAEATADYASSLWHKYRVNIEIYKSSVLTQDSQFGDPNVELTKYASLVVYTPSFCGGLGPLLQSSSFGHLACRHSSVFPIYFLLFGRRPPTAMPPPPADAAAGSALVGCSTPSASCSDAHIWEWVQRQTTLQGAQRWLQRAGQDTFNVSDDIFQLIPPYDANAAALTGSTQTGTPQENIAHSPSLVAMDAAQSQKATGDDVRGKPKPLLEKIKDHFHAPSTGVLTCAAIIGFCLLMYPVYKCACGGTNGDTDEYDSDGEGLIQNAEAKDFDSFSTGGSVQMSNAPRAKERELYTPMPP